MPTPIPLAAIDASAPASRATFRLLARCMDATNRDADTLRHALLAQWDEHGGSPELVYRLQLLDDSDPGGAQGVEGRLAVWFKFTDPGDGRLVSEADPVLAALSEELRTRLASAARPPQD